MKNMVVVAASAFFILSAYACKTAGSAQKNATFNYDYLYNKVWVVDTIMVLGEDAVNIETDKNGYRFTKEGTKVDQGTRTTITSEASIDVPYTIKDGFIHFDPVATFPQTKFDENGVLLSFRDVRLPPYEIIKLSRKRLTLKNDDMLMKLKVQ
jgi:hypothetical protein